MSLKDYSFYQDDWITIYCGDCLEVMPLMEPKSVDLITTSPPYNCRKDYGVFKDQMPWSEYYIFIGSVLDECYRILLKGGTIAINVPGVVRWQADHKFASTWSDFDPDYRTHRNGEQVIGKGRIEPIGFKIYAMMSSRDPHIREPIVWVKGSNGNAICTRYAMGCDSDPYMRPCHEYILIGSKGQWFHRGGTGRRGKDAVPFIDETKDVWFITPTSSDSHPAIFPKEIPSRLIRLFTHATDCRIFDPFMGEGNTILMSKELGRKSIGIEINPKYCEIVVKKLRQEVFDFRNSKADEDLKEDRCQT